MDGQIPVSLVRMFGKLFSKGGNEELKPGPQLCMPMFSGGKGLSPREITAAWRDLFPGEEITIDASEPTVLEVKSVAGSVFIAAMPAPVPPPEIEEAMLASWMWQRGREAVKAQRLHAIVTATGNEDPIAAARLVTHASAALAKAGECVGIYWGNGGQVHEPSFFIDAAKDMEMPTMLWVGLRMSADKPQGPFTLTTMGMRSFGFMELEIIDARMSIGDLRMMALDIATYLLSNGPVLQHGHTFGRTENERLKVEHTVSRFRKGERVLRLHV